SVAVYMDNRQRDTGVAERRQGGRRGQPCSTTGTAGPRSTVVEAAHFSAARRLTIAAGRTDDQTGPQAGSAHTVESAVPNAAGRSPTGAAARRYHLERVAAAGRRVPMLGMWCTFRTLRVDHHRGNRHAPGRGCPPEANVHR